MIAKEIWRGGPHTLQLPSACPSNSGSLALHIRMQARHKVISILSKGKRRSRADVPSHTASEQENWPRTLELWFLDQVHCPFSLVFIP